ncbi:amino acid ABC transporter permease [Treponema zioleckii]|uniref:amino acid ABC transporter permease n=1 Tax=Treponema zioleckii TaxID=331680 RepID=UPI00168B3D1F|nr:amino acid ABC transporter permease [Treponema zioleckii]
MFDIDRWLLLFSDWRVFAGGFLITIAISLVSLVLTLLISLFVGIVRCTQNTTAKNIALAYINFFQNTPLIVQLLFMYNVLPRIGIMLSPFLCGCIGLSLYTGAFGASVFESAIKAIPKGQNEAALSQGMSYIQSLFYIILPQAVKIAIPPMTNQCVNMIKNSATLTVVTAGELMYCADGWAADYGCYTQSFIISALLYLILCLPLSKWSEALEKKLVRG